MKTTLTFFLILFTLIPATLHSQTSQDDKKPRRKRIEKNHAMRQIQELHNGALLVRLQTRGQAIEQLMEQGMAQRAKEIAERQEQINRHIVQAFRAEFTFCPVYFFYTDQALLVKEGKIHDIVFINDDLIPDSSIRPVFTTFLTAEFGNIEQDTAKYLESIQYVAGPNGPQARMSYYGGTDMGFGALLIKNDQFYQLKRPFPFFVKQKTRLLHQYPPYASVRRMNKKLTKYHRRIEKKVSKE